MKDYNELLEILFSKWLSAAADSGRKCDKFFVKDGLMYKSTPVNIQQKWQDSSRRIAFLLKDQNQTNDPNGDFWPDDARTWMISNKDLQLLQGKPGIFFGKLAYILWGLTKMETGEEWWFDEIKYDNLINLFNTEPFAYIETKKQPGGSELPEDVEKEYLSKYGDFLCQELDILEPNIIVCCSQQVYDWAIHHYFDEKAIKINKNLFYDENSNRIVLYSGHPASRTGFKQHYEDNIYWYREFLKTPYGQEFLNKLQLFTAG